MEAIDKTIEKRDIKENKNTQKLLETHLGENDPGSLVQNARHEHKSRALEVKSTNTRLTSTGEIETLSSRATYTLQYV
ncbi:hypothetical protein J6590_082026 [Homalodisca vitripennis]|nr:hypothetical protein J6590_104530 [Homalodisca vitripennis]KAG8324856.1 hypothetical protein J6590_082026 [Homalodisca vitripennis]